MSEPWAIAWLSTSYGFGADLAYFESIFEEFTRRFPDTEIPVAEDWPVAGYPTLPLIPMLAYRDVRLDRILRNGTAYRGDVRIPMPRTVWRIARLRARIFLVIEFTPTALVGMVVAWATRRRTVLLVESDPAFRGARPRWPVNLVKRWVIKHADSVLVSNQAGYRYLRDVVRARMDKVVVGPYLTSNPLSAVSAKPAPRGDAVRLLFLNSISSRKGVIELVEALADLPAGSRHEWTLDLVGDGDASDRVRERAEQLGIAEKITWHGRVPYHRTAAFYAASDVVVCPTLADYRSLAGFEAVNSGRPVLLSSHDGAAEEIHQQQPESRVVDPLDRDAFRDALHAMIVDDRLVARTRAGGLPVPAVFSLAAIADNLEQAVRRALRESTA